MVAHLTGNSFLQEILQNIMMKGFYENFEKFASISPALRQPCYEDLPQNPLVAYCFEHFEFILNLQTLKDDVLFLSSFKSNQ